MALPPGHHAVKMRRWAVVASVLFALLATGCAPSAPESDHGNSDTFYSALEPADAGPMGSVLATERLSESPMGGAGWRLAYRSSDLQGNPTVETAVLYVPDPAPQGEVPPLVVWAHPTVGIDPECAPSRSDGVAQSIPSLSDLLDHGHAVLAPDYIAHDGSASYLIAERAAHALLDAVRAAAHIDSDRPDTGFVVVGFSQGGHAALSTAQFAASYAPELTLAGVAAFAPVIAVAPYLEHTPTGVGEVMISAYLATAFATNYPELDDAVFPAGVRAHLDDLSGDCLGDKAGPTLERAGAALTAFGDTAPTLSQGWVNALTANGISADALGRATSGIPVFLSHGTADALVPFHETRVLAQRLCGEGTALSWYELTSSDHAGAVSTSAEKWTRWLAAVSAGQLPMANCPQ